MKRTAAVLLMALSLATPGAVNAAAAAVTFNQAPDKVMTAIMRCEAGGLSDLRMFSAGEMK